MLTDDQLATFARDGFLVVPGVVDASLLVAADAEIDRVIAAAPPAPDATFKHFYFLPPARLPAAHAALVESGALAIAEELTAPEPLVPFFDHIQIALNIPPYDHHPGGPHIDGHGYRQPDHEPTPDSFTLLAGIFLGDETTVDRGNVWVWPGSHLVHERLFRERGTDVLMANGGHVTMLDRPPPLGEPVPVLGHAGDLLLAHFLLGHNSGGNLTDRTRRMLYYRLGCPDHRSRWAATFTDAFAEFAPLRRFR